MSVCSRASTDEFSWWSTLALHKGNHKLQNKDDGGRPLVKNNNAAHFHSHMVWDTFCTLESQVD